MPQKQSRHEASGREKFGLLGGLTAFVLLMLGFTNFMAYSETTESSGILWWKETHEVPLGERVPYLQGAIIFWALAAILAGLTLWLTLRRPAGRLKRYVPILKGVESMPVQQIAGIVNVSPGRVYRDVQKMIDSDMIDDVYIDYQAGQVVSKKFTPDRSHKTVVACPSCGARSEVIVGITRACSYCGQPLPL